MRTGCYPTGGPNDGTGTLSGQGRKPCFVPPSSAAQAVGMAQIVKEARLTRPAVYRISGDPAGSETQSAALGMRDRIRRTS
jgi:hypothetical protein